MQTKQTAINVEMYPIKLGYLFSGKASVKHLTTTEDIGSPRLHDEEQEKKRPLHSL